MAALPDFTEHDGIPLLRVLRTAGLDALLDWLRGQGQERPVFSDLSLGGWRPRQAAEELAGQLGMTLPPCEDSGHGAAFDAEQPSYAGIIGSGVDAEARGERAVVTAFDDAAAIGRRLVSDPRPVLILVPRFGAPWREENIEFVRFLARHLQEAGQTLTLVGSSLGELPPGPWRSVPETLPGEPVPAPPDAPMGALVPGLLSGEAYRRVGTGVPSARTLELAGGYRLIAPEERSDPASIPRTLMDRFTSAMAGLAWEHAFGQRFGNNLFVDGLQLTDLAWQAFSQGSNDLALELLDRAVSCAKTPAEKAVCHARAQGIRIATQRFAEVAAVPEPSRALPVGLRQFILQTKGWGMVMAGDAGTAEGFFSQPLATLRAKQARDAEDLYLLNIYALARLRQGRADEALAIEKEIQAERAALPVPDHRLAYINCINLARLYKARGELDQASFYYAQAFATSDGARGASESIHHNVIQASMEAAMGREAEARQAWTRAALHWLACAVPEGLGNRVVQAVLGRKPGPEDDVVSAVSDALLQRLGCNGGSVAGTDIHFVEIGDVPQSALEFGFGAPGWSLFVAQAEGTATRRERRCRRRLGAWVWHLLRQAAGVSREAVPHTLAVDTRHGRELAGDARGLLLAAALRGVDQVVWQGEHLDLGERQRDALLRQATLAVGPAVAELELEGPMTFVRFKRYLPPRLLSPEEAGVLREARRGRPYGEIATLLGLAEDAMRRLVRRLAADRLVTMELGGAACTAAGINWPTNET